MDNSTYIVGKRATKTIVGIRYITSNSQNSITNDIGKLWERFFKDRISDKIQNKVSNEIFAVYYDYEADHTKSYTILIGCEIKNDSPTQIQEGLVSKTIESGIYAKFQAVGKNGDNPKSIDCWNVIWKTDLKRRYTTDYEKYSANKVEVCIAINE